MKKTWFLTDYRHLFTCVKKMLMVMRIAIFLVVLTTLQSLAIDNYAQTKRIDLKVSQESIVSVLNRIEDETDFFFFYNNQVVNLDQKVSVDLKGKTINEVLDELFKGTDIQYTINNRQIILSSKESGNPANQQKKTVTGKVSDSSGIPIPGVTVLVKGTTSGTITDTNGNYSISNVQGNATLQFSFVGMKTYKVAVEGKTSINVKLEEETIGIGEVIAIGYGTQKKANLTGAVGNVEMNDMKSRPLTNASLALQGTVAGVYALQSSGKPGDDNAVINIRGVGSFDNNSPLVIIDGFPGKMSDVNPNDIKSISVLKDAASSSIYGNRAANGVILITTIQGTAGKMKVSYNGYYGVQSPTCLPHVLNSVQYVTLHREASANSGSVQTYSEDDLQKFAAHNDPLYPDIDYFKIYYGQAITQNHRISMSGGSDNLQFAFMLGHLNQDGIMVGTNYKKTDFRSNIDAYFLKDKKLRLSTKLAGTLGIKGEPVSVWNATWFATSAPVIPLKYTDGNWFGSGNPYGNIKSGGTTIEKRYHFSGQVEAEYNIVSGLSAQVTYGYNVETWNTNAFNASYVLVTSKAGDSTTMPSDLRVTQETDVHTMLTDLLKYNKTFGKHELKLLAGYQEEDFTYDWQDGYRKNFANNSQRVLNLGDAATQTNNAGSYDLGLRSYFGRINYFYDSKYLFEANIRRDGSSRFAKGHQWGTFPSFSAGWIISKENFMATTGNWLNMLKIRASWGQLGNENIGTGRLYNGSDILASGRNYSLGGTLYSGVAITDMTNKDLTWETSQQTNFGVDVNLDNGIDLTADYFDKRTKNLLLPGQIPLTMALNAPYVNAGEVQNKGFEVSLTYRKTFSNGMKFRATANASHIVNKILKMDVPEQLTSPKAYVVGSAINAFYGYKMDGIYQISDFAWQNNSDPSITYADREYTLKSGVVSVSNYVAQPGDIKYKDINGDGVVDMNNDRVVLGKQFPDLTYALNLSLEWKQFDFSAFFQGVQGIQGYLYYEIAAPFSGTANLGSWWLDRWTPENPSNTMPRLTLDETRTNIHSSFYMQNASYFRLKNIELGYTISPRIISRLGIGSVRIYGNIQNAFTITKFKGFDPEQTTDQTRAEAFPQVQVKTVGLNVNF